MKAILLIHGFLSDRDDFAAIKDKLDDYYNKVEIISLPGHGDDMGVNPFTDVETFAAVTVAFDSLEKTYETIDVIGYSMGGALAIYLASIRKIRKLILLAPSVKYINYQYPIKMMKTYFSLRHQIKVADKQSASEVLEKMERINIDNKISIKLLRDRFLRFKIFPRYYLSFRRIIRKVNNEVKLIDNPCLIIWGEIDQLVPKSSIDYVKSLCTSENVCVKIFDDMSHLMLLSPANAEKIVTEIIKFIKEEV